MPRIRDRKQNLSTSGLLSILFMEPTAKQFLANNAQHVCVPAFNEYITSLCKEFQEIPEHVIKRAGLERSFGHQLFSGRRKPSRDTVLLLAFGFGLDFAGAQELLKVSRHSALYPRIKRDAALIHCLNRRIGITDAQIILSELDLPPLGGAK